MGIERDQRNLWMSPGLARLGFSVPAVHQLVDHVDGRVNRSRGLPLQIGIERSIDTQAFPVEVALAEFLQKLLVNQVDKIRRLAGVDGGVGQMQGLGFGALGLVFGDGAGLYHGIEHKITSLDGALGMVKRVEGAGPLNNAGKKSAFGQIELAHVLAEVHLRGFSDAIDREAAALAERNFIRVKLEDLLLGKAMFKLKGDNDLNELALEPLFRREKKAARQLHGQGGSPRRLLA